MAELGPFSPQSLKPAHQPFTQINSQTILLDHSLFVCSLLLFRFYYLFLFCAYGCLPLYVCLQRMSDPLELKSDIMSHHVDVVTERGSFARPASTLNH